MRRSVGERRLKIGGTTEDSARSAALADDTSAAILKSINSAVMMASEANKKFMARRHA